MALNTFKCNYLTPLHFRKLKRNQGLQLTTDKERVSRQFKRERSHYTTKYCRLSDSDNFELKTEKLVLNTFICFEPLKRFENIVTTVLCGFDKGTSQRALHISKTIGLRIWYELQYPSLHLSESRKWQWYCLF